MIAYTLKNVLELVPEALSFVKKANIEAEYPTDNKDACMASALCIEYQKYVGHQSVDPWVMEKVASSIDIHGMRTEFDDLAEKLVSRSYFIKTAGVEDKQAEFLTKQANFEGEATGFADLEQLSKQASDLYEEAVRFGLTPSEMVRMYSGNAYLSKEAAVRALTSRFQATNNPVFVKLAAAITSHPDATLSDRTVKDLCKTVTGLDKEAGISAKGFNFYKETLFTKVAAQVGATRVKVGKEECPLEAVLRVPDHHLKNYLGADIAKEMRSDPQTAKAVVESLPADLQQVLLTLIKNS